MLWEWKLVNCLPAMTAAILDQAITEIRKLKGEPLNVLEVTKPPDIQYAQNLAQVVHKLSPLIGNMIEFAIASVLNEKTWPIEGTWIRQDPGFPDVLFSSELVPAPGVEIKTWFPLATEITARFKDSISHFGEDHTYVALVAWVPEHLIYGKPRILGVWCDTARSLAQARDAHYHNPPDYLVIEPEDTTHRTRNLQQTNTNGYKFQGTGQQLREAELEVKSWGSGGERYNYTPEYQQKLRELLGHYRYRLDTNFAKMDRIRHQGLEEFKSQILTSEYMGRPIIDWVRRLNPRRKHLEATLHELL